MMDLSGEEQFWDVRYWVRVSLNRSVPRPNVGDHRRTARLYFFHELLLFPHGNIFRDATKFVLLAGIAAPISPLQLSNKIEFREPHI